jgi:hypothetical protein
LHAQADTSAALPAWQNAPCVAFPPQALHAWQTRPSPKKPTLQLQADTSDKEAAGHSWRVALAWQAAHAAQVLPSP